MCRLAAFPPGTTKETAHEIVSSFVGSNTHGVGTCYLKGKSFVIKKAPISYRDAVIKKMDLFDHMPCDSWTIAHVRLATQGEHTYENTHPFIRGDYAIVHNGCFNQSELVRTALNKSVKWQGETDSEVGAYIFDQVGPEKFYKSMYSGVWLGLHRSGVLSGVKCTGDLEILRTSDEKVILASEFPRGDMNIRSRTVPQGAYDMKPDGTCETLVLPKYADSIKKSKTYHWVGNRYVPDDIGYPSGMPPRNPSQSSVGTVVSNACQTGATGTGKILVPTEGKLGVSFWDWLIEEPILEYMKDLR